MEPITLSEDRIIARREVNQHNIDCLTKGVASSLCSDRVRCYRMWKGAWVNVPRHKLICNRCEVRMAIHVDGGEFIGFTKQKQGEFLWES